MRKGNKFERPKNFTERPNNIRPRKESRVPQHSKKPIAAQQQEIKYYGYHACLNLWKSRPDDIIRVYIEQRHVKEASPLLKWCASKSKAYHIISAEEMAKVSDSVHHEGLCILARDLPNMPFPQFLEAVSLSKVPQCLLYLDGVQNPHNIGSIMRVCAHFNVGYILGERAALPKISPSTYRIAQGGAECVRQVALDDVNTSIKKLESMGFVTVASSSHGGKTLYEHTFAPRTIVIMGSESEGIKPALLKSAKETLMIPGSGLVESLNVSVATGLFLGEYYRQVHVKCRK